MTTLEAMRHAAECLAEFRTGRPLSSAGEVDGWHRTITAGLCSAFDEFRAACARLPASDLDEIVATRERLDEAVAIARTVLPTPGGSDDADRSEEPAIRPVPEPDATASTGGDASGNLSVGPGVN